MLHEMIHLSHVVIFSILKRKLSVSDSLKIKDVFPIQTKFFISKFIVPCAVICLLFLLACALHVCNIHYMHAHKCVFTCGQMYVYLQVYFHIYMFVYACGAHRLKLHIFLSYTLWYPLRHGLWLEQCSFNMASFVSQLALAIFCLQFANTRILIGIYYSHSGIKRVLVIWFPDLRFALQVFSP